MRIGFIEPHMGRFGGIRRVVELGNHLVDRGHEITYFVPPNVPASCDWMPCAGAVKHLEEVNEDTLDFVIYNNEPDWHYLDTFPNAGRTVYFALHYARLYDKEGSWESLHKDVDLFLANSTWTADMLERETGIRPETFSGGINPDHFHSVDVPKEYPILTMGDTRPWKGHDVILEAARILDLPVEKYAGKDLPQSAMAEEYGKAEVFVVGSDFEGFGQPGIESLACGTPLVTTDNGGCRDYAIDGETALVVPPRDPRAMADAIARIRRDPALRERLRQGGLDIVRERFSWSKSAADLERILEAAGRGEIDHRRHTGPLLRTPPANPTLSLVVLPWDQKLLTEKCVTSLRLHTDVEYELVIVDNGSQPVARSYAEQAADTAILNETNLGFAVGMNQGLAAATGEYVAFINNDTVFRANWASQVLETLARHPKAGIVAPAVTAASNPINVLTEPGTRTYAIPPFSAPPGAVVWVMKTDTARALGGFPEYYEVASGEDVDLAFRVWVNDLDVVIDERVLVTHVSKGTAGTKLDDWKGLWRKNRERFLSLWTDPRLDLPRLDSCPEPVWSRNRATAMAAAGWMKQYFDTRDALYATQKRVTDTRDEVRTQERERYDRLRNRRSVRAALTLSRAAEPLVRGVRRLRDRF
ncbi:MAG: glycosyltransferase [Acidimicrobiia bacterium]|nr:glycosyltransferase [Acidimicrobiia bacterium]